MSGAHGRERAAEALLRSDPSLLTGRQTIVEVRRNLARLLGEADASTAFADDVRVFSIVEITRKPPPVSPR